MTIAYIRTYSNKQQTESQKNAIEQFAKAKKIEIDKWLKDAKARRWHLHLGLFLRLKANLFLPVRKKH